MPGLHPNLGQLARALSATLGLAEAQLAPLPTGMILRAHPISLLQTNLHLGVDFPIVYISLHFLDLHNLLKSLVSSLWSCFFVFYQLLLIPCLIHQHQPH